VDQEIRLAVVLYGGVSLAIYISGVTRELFDLVRATAPDSSGAVLLHESLSGAGEVYRKLARLLDSKTLTLDELRRQSPGPPIHTRFVIDVISGTSAGGINGIVLAKALANKLEIDNLQKLWLDEGDVAGLINDSRSLKDGTQDLRNRGLKLTEPAALLNGQRMYAKLLDAFGAMDGDAAEATERHPAANTPSPYVDELDLFVTTTDLEGLVEPIRLADDDVSEKRYKNVFHFIYAKEEASGEARNDFVESNNPFLAFAARCTSSFPVAFEPMQLKDISSLDPYRADSNKFDADVKSWQSFFKRYSPQDFLRRNFGDGGYLHNKPFSYATDTLFHRRANLLTHRKLIYVEPSPEDLLQRTAAGKPDALSNAIKALVTLPGYQTIREDIERLDQRNGLIERVRRITDDVERDVARGMAADLIRPKSGMGNEYAKKDLGEMIRIKGVAYGGYHRLKIAAVTDELAELIARLADIKEDFQEFQTLRDLVAGWRCRRYTDYFKGAPQCSETQFLVDLDLSYRLRRINFLRLKIGEVYGASEQQLHGKLELIHEPQLITALESSPFSIDEFCTELHAIMQTLNVIFVKLRRLGRNLRSGKDEGETLPELVRQADASGCVREILQIRNSERRREEMDRLMDNETIASGFDAIAGALRAKIRPATENARIACLRALADGDSSPSISLARRWMRHYYDYFDDYDMIAFPITYGTAAGEPTPVETIRVSPHDATSLVDERKEPRKLAGTTLFHFGGFLDRLWRQNDMLWGRLDGAERIITTMLPDRQDDAKQLVQEAHRAILSQELAEATNDDRYHGLVSSLLGRLQNQTAAPNILKEYPPDRKGMARITARATTVIGKLLRGITPGRGASSHRAAVWLASFGSLFWGLIEVSVADTTAHRVFRRGRMGLFIIGFILVIAGIVWNVGVIEGFGFATLGITILAASAVWTTGNLLRNRGRSLRWYLIIVGAVLGLLLILGGIEAVQLLVRARHAAFSAAREVIR
jgi:patatin-related protein